MLPQASRPDDRLLSDGVAALQVELVPRVVLRIMTVSDRGRLPTSVLLIRSVCAESETN